MHSAGPRRASTTRATTRGLLALWASIAPLASAQPAGSATYRRQPITVLIDKFEKLGAEGWDQLDKSGPDMLMDPLFEVLESSPFVELSVIERGKLPTELATARIPEVLKYNPKEALQALKQAGVQYAIFPSYQKSSGENFRIQARLVKVDGLESKGGGHVLCQRGPADPFSEPLKELARSLKRQLYRALRLPVADVRYQLAVCKYQPPPAADAGPLPGASDIPKSILGELQSLRLQSVERVEPDIVDCTGTLTRSAAATSQLLVRVELMTAADPGSSQARLNLMVTLVHASMGMAANVREPWRETQLLELVHAIALKLGKSWEVTADRWVDTPVLSTEGGGG